jgi:superfamily II DNA helicase RecQ
MQSQIRRVATNTSTLRSRPHNTQNSQLHHTYIMTTDFDDEFGLDEDDEQALQALADADDGGKHERKHARNESGVADGPPTKVLKTNDEQVDNVALNVATDVLKKRFKLPGFRLKQSLAISRILNGGSSVVVFPTGEIGTKLYLT